MIVKTKFLDITLLQIFKSAQFFDDLIISLLNVISNKKKEKKSELREKFLCY